MAMFNDSNLVSLRGELKDPLEFVRRVFGNMSGFERECQVRVATDSNPRAPDYLVEMLIYDEETGLEIIHAQAIAIYSGKTHVGEVAMGGKLVRAWSRSAMTWHQVQTLIGQLRGILPES